jgi:hypothetical protein
VAIYGPHERARVVSFDVGSGGYKVEVITRAQGRMWGPVMSTVPGLQENDRVILAQVGMSADEYVIIGRLPGTFPDFTEIPGLVAALAAKADDTEITTINGTLAAHAAELVVQDGRLDAHDAALTTLDGRVDTHDTDLAALDTRLDVEEAKVGYVLPVANGAARPVTGLYNGFPVYRQDKSFMEFYNGAGSWRLRQFSLVGALADVDFPVGGQVVMLATDLMLYRYDSGTSAWLAFQHTVAGGGHARYNLAAGHPNIAASTVTKVAFNTATTVTADVTQSVDKKEFTLNRTGSWFLACKLPYAGGTAGGASRFAWIAPASNDTIRYAGGSTPPSSYIMVPGGSDTVRLTSGTVLSVYAYQDAATSMGFDITGLQGSFTARWEGP